MPFPATPSGKSAVAMVKKKVSEKPSKKKVSLKPRKKMFNFVK